MKNLDNIFSSADFTATKNNNKSQSNYKFNFGKMYTEKFELFTDIVKENDFSDLQDVINSKAGRSTTKKAVRMYIKKHIENNITALKSENITAEEKKIFLNNLYVIFKYTYFTDFFSFLENYCSNKNILAFAKNFIDNATKKIETKTKK
jgi:hypothetical protein